MKWTHEMFSVESKLNFYYNAHSKTIYSLDGNVFLTTNYSIKDLEVFSWTLKEIVINLENE